MSAREELARRIEQGRQRQRAEQEIARAEAHEAAERRRRGKELLAQRFQDACRKVATRRLTVTLDHVFAELPRRRCGLAQFGYKDGQNLVIEYRHAEGSRLSEHAGDLVRLNVDVIYARGPAAVRAAIGATRTVPVVAIDLESDPVAVGFARGLAQPGGNITGVFLDLPELGGKQLQLLKEIIPQLSHVAVLGDPILNASQFRATESAARVLAIDLQRREAKGVNDFSNALDATRKTRARAVLILSSPLVYSQRAQIGALVIERRMPAVSMFVEFAEAGGLVAYGPSVREASRRCGAYVGRILQGAKPGEMPIERPQTFELAVNLKTAKVLGLTIPPSVLGRADHVIE